MPVCSTITVHEKTVLIKGIILIYWSLKICVRTGKIEPTHSEKLISEYSACLIYDTELVWPLVITQSYNGYQALGELSKLTLLIVILEGSVVWYAMPSATKENPTYKLDLLVWINCFCPHLGKNLIWCHCTFEHVYKGNYYLFFLVTKNFLSWQMYDKSNLTYSTLLIIIWR